MPAADMAAFMLVAIDVSVSLLAVAYDAVTPFTRMLSVSVGLSLPLPCTAPVTLAAAGAAVMLTAQLAAVIEAFEGLATMLTFELVVALLAVNSPWTDVGSVA